MQNLSSAYNFLLQPSTSKAPFLGLVLTISFGLLVNTNLTHAQSVVVERQEDNQQLILKAENCDLVKTHVDAFMSWTQRIGEPVLLSPEIDNILPEKNESNILVCAANITDIVPQVVKHFHGIRPQFDGPNCWNSSLVLSHILPALRYSTPEEMSLWMVSPFCNKVANGEAIQAGDVVAVRESYYDLVEEVHGFIYLTPQLAFSKNGYSNYSPFALQSLKGVFDTYGVEDKSECLRSDKTEKGCRLFANYFRCNPIQTEIQEYQKINQDFKDVNNDLDQLETEISEVAMSGLNASFQKDMLNIQIQAYEPLIAKWVKILLPDALEKLDIRKALFLWKGLEYRAAASVEQLSMIYVPR